MIWLNKLLKGTFSIDTTIIRKTKWTQLTNRSLLILNGPDTNKLLQGLITNDMKQLKTITFQNQAVHRIALYTLFLMPVGKLITDAFIFRPRVYQDGKAKYLQNQYWIDVDKQNKNKLKEHLSRHMWRKKIKMVDVQDSPDSHKPTIYSGYNEQNDGIDAQRGISLQLPELQQGQDQTYANLIYFDPRGSKFGLRVISSQEKIQIEGHFQQISQKQNKKIFQRIGQAPKLLPQNKLPFQFNYDMMNAISLKKGCFIGQQIISRGFLTGIIRKRIFPFVLDETLDDSQVAKDTKIIDKNGKQLGKILTYSQGQGIALINYLGQLQKGNEWPIVFTTPFKGKILCPFQKHLQKYYQQMKDKQKILQQLQL